MDRRSSRALASLLSALAATGCGPVRQGGLTIPEATARRAVAEFSGVRESDVAVISVQAQEFPDASLACPDPGTTYPQVITPGARVIAEAEGRRFDVRVAGERSVICWRTHAGDAAPGTRPAPANSMADAARADLAARLGVDADAIAVAGMRERQRGEALPGCATSCTKTGACGHLITLRLEDRQFLYLGSATGVRPCPALGSR